MNIFATTSAPEIHTNQNIHTNITPPPTPHPSPSTPHPSPSTPHPPPPTPHPPPPTPHHDPPAVV
nr:MAG: hypothetical protein EDM05_32020 [Leptolyngbya sp. IPPAS B-1204]